MTTAAPSPMDVVSAFLAAMQTGDYDRALPLLSETCEYANVPMATVRGRAAVREVLEPFFAPTLENELIVKRTVSEGSVVFMERLDRHRLATGWVELPVAGVWEVHDGQITLWRDYFDAATLLSKWPTA